MTQGSSQNIGAGRNRKMNAIKMNIVPLRETIHSGHFMVSDFEPESEVQDDEYEAGMPIPQGPEDTVDAVGQTATTSTSRSSTNLPPPASVVAIQPFHHNPFSSAPVVLRNPQLFENPQAAFGIVNNSISIDGSLTKLFQCMSLAYRQKLTSPKWNRFKGVRLRWKDKIRLNNVIWRCWHMQFILKQKTLVCQFASPLDVDQHNKPEAVVMEGKYWKRKLSTVAAEYKKWRLFYRNKIMGWTLKEPTPDLHPVSLDGFDWNRSVPFGSGPISNLIFDDDFLMDFSDTLFSSLSSNQLAFPNPRELARAGMVAEFIQPGLVQLQPNLDDFMDTLDEPLHPLHDYVNSKLPPVPEELDTLEPPDSLLTVDVLPPMMQKTSSSSSRSNGHAGSLRGSSTYSSSVASTNPVYYQMSSMEQSNRTGETRSTQSSASSVNNSASQPSVSSSVAVTASSSLSTSYSTTSSKASMKESHHGPSTSSRSPSGFSRNNGFVVPKGKPRGRSRNSGSGRQALTGVSPQPASCPPATAAMSHQTMNSMAHSQMANTISVNSNTLLSHLLTSTGGSMEKIPQASSMVGGNQMMGSNGNNMMPSIVLGLSKDIQQHNHQSQQPWNPKNANETLNANNPINFGISKPLMQNYNQPINVGVISSGGNVSPPLLPNTPSPPHMAPPGGPGSPSKQQSFRPKGDSERVPHKEHRRVCHINAEQKRRCNIKNGFDMLHSLIPQLSQNPNSKVCGCDYASTSLSVSKAAMLQKGAEYIRQLKMERAQLKEEIEAHRQEVEALNSAINNCQSMLPATGAPVSRQRTNKMKEMFDHWVRMRTTDNWRFWIFSILIRPLLDSYNNSVSTASVDELCRTVLAWVDQHCSLVDLRPAVLNSLRYLCTTTDILTNPGNLPEEAREAVNRTEQTDRESR